MKTIFNNEAPLPDNHETAHPMDVVAQLGRTRRFNGSANPEWTVLHHTALVTLLWLRRYGPEDVHHMFMHDLHEYVTGDIPSPVKHAIGRDAVEKVQDVVDDRIYASLKLSKPTPNLKRCIKFIDLAALFIEAHYIGLPGHVKHIIDTSISHISNNDRIVIASVVREMFPDVYADMEKNGFFDAPYEE